MDQEEALEQIRFVCEMMQTVLTICGILAVSILYAMVMYSFIFGFGLGCTFIGFLLLLAKRGNPHDERRMS